jgi:hypothetical protein
MRATPSSAVSARGSIDSPLGGRHRPITGKAARYGNLRPESLIRGSRIQTRGGQTWPLSVRFLSHFGISRPSRSGDRGIERPRAKIFLNFFASSRRLRENRRFHRTTSVGLSAGGCRQLSVASDARLSGACGDGSFGTQ